MSKQREIVTRMLNDEIRKYMILKIKAIIFAFLKKFHNLHKRNQHFT